MISAQEYLDLQKELATKQKEQTRRETLLERSLASLKDDFGCSSIKEAEVMLKKLTRKLEANEEKFRKEMEAFRKEFPQLEDQ